MFSCRTRKCGVQLHEMFGYWFYWRLSWPYSWIHRLRFYGWENYVPFKGKSEAAVGKLDYLLNFDSEQLGKELQDAPHSFEGRVSESDNSIVQTMTDATRAAMRAGRADLTLSIKNAIEQTFYTYCY